MLLSRTARMRTSEQHWIATLTIKKHTVLLAYSFITWLVFYLLGLPDYYQQ